MREHDPDMILTLETDHWWENALRTRQEAYLHALKNPLDNAYGMLLHSRLKMIEPEIRFILRDSNPSMHMQVLSPSVDRFFMHFGYPDPPNPKYASETTKRDAELLIVGREVENRDRLTFSGWELQRCRLDLHHAPVFREPAGCSTLAIPSMPRIHAIAGHWITYFTPIIPSLFA